ncbi:MAG: glycosyltransferase [Gemmatirosa sp.]
MQPPGRSLRIAFCIDSLASSGGTELNAVRVAEQLAAQGHHLEVFTLRAEGAMGTRYASAGIPVHEVSVRSLVGVRTLLQVHAFAARLRAGRFDVVHSHDLYTNVVATCAARWAGVPAVVASKRWMQWRRSHRILNRAAFRLAHTVLGNSERVAHSLSEEDGVPVGRVAVVPNFVEEEAFERWPAGETEVRRRALGIPDGAPVVGIVARLREEKDHALLLDAIALARLRVPGVRLLLVGDGPEQETLERRVDALGLRDTVIFAGHLPNRPNPHLLFDVSVLCSKHEGFPNTVIEAMAAARPVVATAVGGVPDAVVDGETGLLVPPGDAAALAEGMTCLLRDGSRSRRMGAAGLARARAIFHVDAVLPRLTQRYEVLLTSSRHTASTGT